ncbi:bifunctional riboflavin kinase/FAD synthetase [Pseudactinotalea sp. HY160]|uniref:bifunctional riboflavin kinase/FAD synthetase n=1 Tax=Pseudactinotalea sp. HY160 TaxID=2654490 RepID=UPI001311AC1B|nr:bifunctional riboflavin kinase/FAD synthetase [Pseudactinotalea sp. HY160]
MQIWRGLKEIPADVAGAGTAITIGNFDGVHTGHAAVLAATVRAARERGVMAVAITFDPHPARIHRPEGAPVLLTGLADRLDLLAAAGLDACLVIHYTPAFAAQSAVAFARTYLRDGLGARAVVVGEDIRFGAGNEGDRGTMAELGGELGFEVGIVTDVPADGSHRRASSTWVRELLAAGAVADARRILGRWHRMRGVVVHGQARGRDLGFPTANLAPDASGTIPADGVYAGWLTTDWGSGTSERMPAAISIGTNPTFSGMARVVEAHVLGRTDLELYGREIVVEFVARLRPTLKFDGIDELIARMNTDVDQAADLLGVPRPSVRPSIQPIQPSIQPTQPRANRA